MADSHNNEPDEPSSASTSSPQERSPWYVMGIFGAMGFEFVGFIIGGFIVGTFVDTKLASGPWGAIIGALLGLVGVLWHIWRVAKKLMK